MTAPKISPDAPLETVWKGAGWFNVYFFAKFALAYFGYLNLEPAYNALLFAAVVLPIGTRAFDLLRNVVCALAAAALLWHESWLPGPEAIRANAHNLTDFTASFLLDFVINAVNPVILAWLAAGIVAWLFLRRWIRFSTLTVIGLVVTAFPQLVTWALPTEKEAPAKEVAAAPESAPALRSERAAGPLQPPQPANGTGEDVDRWLTAFFTQEENRGVSLPAEAIPESVSGVFDIAVVNICSLSNDDLEASNLQDHRVFSRFNIKFDKFNSATSYSGPAALRLLTGACGQPSHDALYDSRRPDCEIMNRLDSLGFKQHLFLDHSGAYDNYLNTMRTQAGLTATFEQRKFPLKYMSFNNEEIADTLSVLRHWNRVVTRDKDVRSVSLFNFIALHDGNRLPLHSRWEAFEPRAKAFLDSLNTFINELEKGKRKVLLVVVPEHGAAVRGDRIQTPRLRDIPSRRITQVPVLVKFIGVDDLPKNQIHVTTNTSYLGLSTLIGRVIETNFFSKKAGAVPLETLVQDLPTTHMVSENGQAAVLEYKGRDYMKLNRGKWEPYGGEP